MKQHSTQLIDGTFSPEKAKSILLQLLNDKMNFHYLEKVSNEERFGKDHEHSDKRIAELTDGKMKLIKWLQSVPPGEAIKINCVIELQLESTLHSGKQAAAL